MRIYTLTASTRAQQNTIANDTSTVVCAGDEITLSCKMQDKPKTLHVVIGRAEFNEMKRLFDERDNFIDLIMSASKPSGMPNDTGSLV